MAGMHVGIPENSPETSQDDTAERKPSPANSQESTEGFFSAAADLESALEEFMEKTGVAPKKPSPANSQESTDSAVIKQMMEGRASIKKSNAFLTTIGIKSKAKSNSATKTEPTEMVSTVASAPEEKPSYSSILKRTPPKMTKAGAAANKNHPGAIHNMLLLLTHRITSYWYYLNS